MPNDRKDDMMIQIAKDDGGCTEGKKSEAWSVCMAARVRVEMVALDWKTQLHKSRASPLEQTQQRQRSKRDLLRHQ
jgi:hypothetical protein